MAVLDPQHPGGIVSWQCLEPLGLTVTLAAERQGVTRLAPSELSNGRAGISVEMAIRLSKAFGSTPETWLRMPMAYDLCSPRGTIGPNGNTRAESSGASPPSVARGACPRYGAEPGLSH